MIWTVDASTPSSANTLKTELFGCAPDVRTWSVGQRNGRKLAHMAEDSKDLIHQIVAQHSSKSARKLSSSAFGGPRGVVNLVRGSRTVLNRSVSYKFGLANGSRGNFIGAVYEPGWCGHFSCGARL